MEKVKRAVAAGVSLSAAVRDALAPGTSIRSVAFEHQVPRKDLSEILNGVRDPQPRELEILIGVLGGTATDWYDLVDIQRQRRRQAAAAGV